MIADIVIGGVFVPSLLTLLIPAVVATIALLNLLALGGISRSFVPRPLAEIALFAIIYGLLAQHLSSIGPFH